MELKSYYDEMDAIENQMFETRKKLEELIDLYSDTRKKCTHDIIFKFKDNYPRKQPIDGCYYCPSCRLVIECAAKGQIEQTKFKNARMIPLLILSLRNGSNVHNAIRQEVYSNLDYYYNPNSEIEEMSEKMEGVLLEHHFDYLNPNKVLKK